MSDNTLKNGNSLASGTRVQKDRPVASDTTMTTGDHVASEPTMKSGDRQASEAGVTSDSRLASGDSLGIGGTLASGRSALVLLNGTQASLEKARIAVGNRVAAITRGSDATATAILVEYDQLHRDLVGWEARIEKLMAKNAAEHPVWDPWLSHVKGIGPALGSQLLAMLLPPLVDRGPSTWYKAAGLVPSEVDGQSRLPRPRAGGEKLTYYPRLRRTLHNVAESFVRSGGYYRDIYDQKKARLVAQHKDDPKNWPPHRLDSVARWLTVKLFLAHLYEMWLRAEGKGSGRKAYVLEVLGHTGYIAPPEWNGKTKM